MNPSSVTDHSSPITNYLRVSIIILKWNGLENMTSDLGWVTAQVIWHRQA